MLRVVDISSYQGDKGIDPAALDCDAVIVKATGGKSYVNDYWREHADAVLASGKLLGLYHYAKEKNRHGTVQEEADLFLDTIADYIGRAVLALDWEAEAQMYPVSWAREWMDYVASATGATPFFYAYASYLNSRDHRELTAYPLWMASYLYRYTGAGWVSDPSNIWATSSWDHMAMYQYTSTGNIDGYDDVLDLSVFYGSASDWNRLKGGTMGSIKKFCDAMRWAADSDNVGYSQSDRYSLTPEKFFTDELTNSDCSELTIVALKYAGFDTGNAVTTRNMSSELCARGWVRLPVDTPLQAGDILLNDEDHVAVWLGDCLAQASIGEGGLVSGGARGDQTGWEVNTRDYYNYPWNCILRWTGEQDESEDDMGIYDAHESVTGDKTVGSPSDRIDYIDMRVRELVEPHKSAAGDGNKDGIRAQVDYIDKRVKSMDATLKSIEKMLTKMAK